MAILKIATRYTCSHETSTTEQVKLKLKRYAELIGNYKK